MDPRKWKEIKRSGTFKRRVKKHYQELKSKTTAPALTLPVCKTINGQEDITEIRNDDENKNWSKYDEHVCNQSNSLQKDSCLINTNLDVNNVANTNEINLYVQNTCDNSTGTDNLSEINDRDSEFHKDLKKWAVDFNISHEAIKSLSIVINRRLPNIVPKDPRTLLRTNDTDLTFYSVGTGQYWHNGLSSPLRKILENLCNVPDNIALIFNIDGLPLYKSSRQQVWPILCQIFEKRNIPPFVVGIYAGTGKPSDLDAYLQHFVAELKDLLQNNLKIKSKDGSKKNLNVKVRAFVCDSPARALIKGVCNFNGKHGCLKCTVVGEYCETSHTVVFPKIDCPRRNDRAFRSKIYGQHHKYDSPLLQLPIDMIEDIPVGDSLHLIDLGIMKRLLSGWRDGNLGKYITKWCSRDIINVSRFLVTRNMPIEIHRSVRSLEDLAHWKASEFRTFLLYLSFIILKDVLCHEAFYHFLCFFCSITICSNEQHFTFLRLATEMLKYFVTNYSNIYGKGYVTSNVHNLVHVVEEVKKFGVLQNFNAYPFENKLSTIKKLVRQGNRPLSQIAKRLMERSFVEMQNFDDDPKSEIPFINTKRSKNGVVSVLHLKNCVLSTQNSNKWFLNTKNQVVEILSIYQNSEGIIQIQGYYLENCGDAFEAPMKSSLPNIYMCDITTVTKFVSLNHVTDIKCKLVCVTHNEHIHFIPLVHTL